MSLQDIILSLVCTYASRTSFWSLMKVLYSHCCGVSTGIFSTSHHHLKARPSLNQGIVVPFICENKDVSKGRMNFSHQHKKKGDINTENGNKFKLLNKWQGRPGYSYFTQTLPSISQQCQQTFKLGFHAASNKVFPKTFTHALLIWAYKFLKAVNFVVFVLGDSWGQNRGCIPFTYVCVVMSKNLLLYIVYKF